jgi:hypothetical protein
LANLKEKKDGSTNWYLANWMAGWSGGKKGLIENGGVNSLRWEGRY